MKTKVAVLLLAFASLAQAGPRVFISTGNRGAAWCPPAASYCPPVVRTIPTWYGCPRPAIYNWGPTVQVYSGYSGIFQGSGFSTISPVVSTAPIIRVPPPIIPSTPLTVYPASTFRWRP